VSQLTAGDITVNQAAIHYGQAGQRTDLEPSYKNDGRLRDDPSRVQQDRARALGSSLRFFVAGYKKTLQEAAGLARKNGRPEKVGQNDQVSFVAQTQEVATAAGVPRQTLAYNVGKSVQQNENANDPPPSTLSLRRVEKLLQIDGMESRHAWRALAPQIGVPSPQRTGCCAGLAQLAETRQVPSRLWTPSEGWVPSAFLTVLTGS
jgi:hypothetical protein